MNVQTYYIWIKKHQQLIWNESSKEPEHQDKRLQYRSPKDWDVHHIDFDHDSNNLENLIAVPKRVHTVIHQCGYMSKDEIENLIQIYNDSSLVIAENNLF